MKGLLVIIIVIAILLFFFYDFAGSGISGFTDPRPNDIKITPVAKSYNNKPVPPIIDTDAPKIIMCNALYESVKKQCDD